MQGLWYNYVQWSIVAGGIALHVVLLFMHQGIFHELCVITEPYLFFSVYCLSEKINTRLKLLYAQFSFVRKVPVVVNDQTHTYVLHIHTYRHIHAHTLFYRPIRSVDKGEFGGPHR